MADAPHSRAPSPSAFPLQWPIGRPGCKRREAGRFATVKRSTDGSSQPVTVAESVERVSTELDRLGAKLAVLSSNIELRRDGLPRSGRPEPEDPGVALYFQLKGKPMVLACDRFDKIAQNIAAIAAHIEATRRIERYGVATTEQMFEGFLSLPGPMVINDWRAALNNPSSLADAEATWRRKMKSAHPDAGGSEATAAVLNAAITEARKVYGAHG